MKSKWIALSPAVYVRRDDDAIDTYVTGNDQPPATGGDNVISTFRASVEQFADLVSAVQPGATGVLVNVGTAKIPCLVPQTVAPLIQSIILSGGAEALDSAELVNVGDDTNALLLTRQQAEVFSSILVESIHGQVDKALEDARVARDTDAAALATKLEATAINVGADAGLKLLLQPGDAAVHKEIVELAVQAALDRAAAAA